MSVILSDHARRQASRRGIDEVTLRAVAESLQQIVPGPGRARGAAVPGPIRARR